MKRQSGILMPVFSLPSIYGIGDFGESSYKFIDFLEGAGQTVWQILPLVQTGYGNSPYSSVCSDSFSPYYISPELLYKDGLLTQEEISFTLSNKQYIDYGELYSVRFPLLKKAFERFDKNDAGFKQFVDDKQYFDYAMYMSIKYASGQKHFYEWEDGLKRHNENSLNAFYNDYKNEVLFWQFVQFTAQKQWLKVKAYANGKGIKIIGDMPLYVALDSVDVWVNPKCFKIDDNFVPKKVAGVPPDFFCREGQLWGNPVYDYENHKKDKFLWWINRMQKVLSMFDFVRIDHFRGLDRFYEVDNGAPNAMIGEWVKVPSKELFSALHKRIDKKRVIAEDLGIIDDGVRELLKATGYPGMKILSFAFNGEPNNLYLPQNVNENSVCYTGTHDNDTLFGLIKGASEWDKNNLYNGVRNSLELLKIDLPLSNDVELLNAIIELGFACPSKLFILPMGDILYKDTLYRINEPGTVKMQNWSVKYHQEDFSDNVKERLKELSVKYKRN